ncbi:RICIN domain-containing protein [Paenibacillus sp. Marseille-Q4541]|uniref:RICIN domain-containing protein n=1 Tax=Paenibacillus sp. Marseille-Q4541 TaxID=2831522 RepID=UPI001BA5D17F|nr:RICIN domain-containing protein [Paenibacillus sp. Marseille-Q4541]
MGKQLIKRRFTAMVTVSALIFSLCTPFLQGTANASSYTAVVNPDKQYQTWEGWGTSLAWFANRIGGAEDATRNWYADQLFDVNQGLGFNIVRYNIGGGENPKHHFLELRAAVPGFKASPTADYDWSSDANQRWVLQAAKERNQPQEFIAEAFANSPPWWMTNSGSVTGPLVPLTDNLKSDMFDDFADYLTTVVKHFKDNEGITFRTLSPINEPDGFWVYSNRQEGAFYSQYSRGTIIQHVHDALVQKGLPTTQSSADSNAVFLARDTINAYTDITKSMISQYNVHTYYGNDTERKQVFYAAGNKPIWMSEHGDGEANGIEMSRSIVSDIKYMKNSAWVYWQAVEDNAAPGWGMIETDLNDANNNAFTPNVKQKFWSMAQWSKFIRPGYKIIDIEDGDSIAAYDAASQKLVIVTVNDRSASNDVTYDLSKFGDINGSVTAYRTVAPSNGVTAENFANINVALNNKSFQNTVPAYSVTTYVVDGVNLKNHTSSAAVDTSAYYKIVNKNSGKVMDVKGAYLDDSASVIQYTDNGGTNQQWQFVDMGRGIYKIKNHNSGKMLEIQGESTSDSAQAIQYHDTEWRGVNQEWKLIDAGGGYYNIVNINSDKVLDVKGESTSNSASIIQYTGRGSSNQLWKLVKVN